MTPPPSRALADAGLGISAAAQVVLGAFNVRNGRPGLVAVNVLVLVAVAATWMVIRFSRSRIDDCNAIQCAIEHQTHTRHGAALWLRAYDCFSHAQRRELVSWLRGHHVLRHRDDGPRTALMLANILDIVDGRISEMGVMRVEHQERPFTHQDALDALGRPTKIAGDDDVVRPGQVHDAIVDGEGALHLFVTPTD